MLERYVAADLPQDLRAYVAAEFRKIQQFLDGFAQGFVPISPPPVINGLTTAGAGTYGVQAGSYYRVGQLVIFFGAFLCSAHTGTGAVTVPLPVKAKSGVAHGSADSTTFTIQDVSIASGVGPTGVAVFKTPGPATANNVIPGGGGAMQLNFTIAYIADDNA